MIKKNFEIRKEDLKTTKRNYKKIKFRLNKERILFNSLINQINLSYNNSYSFEN